MKRGWKIFWVVCAVCAGIGLVCCSISFSMGVTVEAIEKRYPNGFGFVSRVDRYDGYYEDDEEDDDYDFSDSEDDSDSTHRTEVVYGTRSQSFTGVEAIDVYMWGGILEVDHASSSNEIQVETENISKRLGLKCYMDGSELKLVTK